MDHGTTMGNRADLLSVTILNFLLRNVEPVPAG